MHNGAHVETAAISYRVADFLKRHPPFNAIDDTDLLEDESGSTNPTNTFCGRASPIACSCS
jgi:hypothetical protein